MKRYELTEYQEAYLYAVNNSIMKVYDLEDPMEEMEGLISIQKSIQDKINNAEKNSYFYDRLLQTKKELGVVGMHDTLTSFVDGSFVKQLEKIIA